MANDKQSLANYEAILWLWDASDQERVQFLASLERDQRIQFCDVLRDVLNNPWEGRSAIKLTKLNKLLGQNVDRIKKQVQFSGDRTPELDEAQLFRLLHDYLVLNHDGTRRLTELGRQSLEKLLEAVNAEFETYYDRDESHPDLMWNGFQNDTLFPGAGAAKTQVEPTDYGELNAKIANYYYPAGGGTPPPGDAGEGRDEEDDGRDGRGEDRGGGAPVPKGLWVLYLPFFLGYTSIALYYGFARNNGLLGLALVLGTAFAAVKWYNVVRFAVRGWAALLQGAWIVYLLLAGGADAFRPLAIANLVWPVGAFWLLARGLHRQKKFAAVWTGILSLVCAAAVAGVVLSPRAGDGDGDGREDDRDAFPAAFDTPDGAPSGAAEDGSSPLDAFHGGMLDVPNRGAAAYGAAESIPSAPPAEDGLHIEKLRAEPGGLRWDALLAEDLPRLTDAERDYLRSQLTVLLREASGRHSDVGATAMEGLEATGDERYPWKAAVTLDRGVMRARTDDFGLGGTLRLGPFHVVSPGPEAGVPLDFRFGVPRRNRILFRLAGGNAPPLESDAAVFADAVPALGDTVLDGSAAATGLRRLAAVAEALDRRIRTDEVVASADGRAAERLAADREARAALRQGVLDMFRDARRNGPNIVGTLPDALELAIWRQEHPGELTEAEKRLKERWVAAKGKCLGEAARMKTVLAEKRVSPWKSDPAGVRRLETALREFEAAAAGDDFRTGEEKFAALRKAFGEFEAGARWQAGVSRGDGYRSGASPGRWELAPGYELVNGRPMRVSVCGTCKGAGTIERRHTCAECRGAGTVDNPAALAKDLGGLFGVRVPVNVPRKIRCDACGGKGWRAATERCTACGGSGKTYR